jgi:Protein of unknown function (DUF2934)
MNKLTEAKIRQRAYELYLQSGCKPGRDVENWLAAETDLMLDMLVRNEGAKLDDLSLHNKKTLSAPVGF